MSTNITPERKIIFTAAILFLLSIACGNLASQVEEPPGIIQTMVFTETPNPTAISTSTEIPPCPTLTPAEPFSTLESESSVQPQAIGNVRDAGLIDRNVGWVLSSNTDLLSPGQDVRMGGSLFLTDGAGWRNITPPLEAGEIIGDVFFQSGQNAWVAMIHPDGNDEFILTIRLMRTENAGESWYEVGVLEADSFPGLFPEVRSLQFLDAKHGWLQVPETMTMNSAAGSLYRTNDGGASWEKSKLPYDGELEFITLTDGWFTGNCCTGAPEQLYWTTDGGETWVQQVVAPNPVDDGFDYNEYLLPTFFDPQTGILPVILRDEGYSAYAVSFFMTADGGVSWKEINRFDPLPGIELLGSGVRAPIEIITLDQWMIGISGAMNVTLNEGVTWKEYKQNNITGFQLEMMFIGQIGWSIVVEDNCSLPGFSCQKLAETLDGGRNWRIIFGANRE